MIMNDKESLHLAMEEAQQACKRGDFPVGTVLLKQGSFLIGHESNSIYSSKGYIHHAEMKLLIRSQQYLWNNTVPTTLYSTLEPCIMCMGAAVINHVTRIVWLIDDNWAGGTHSYFFESDFLRSKKTELLRFQDTLLRREAIKMLSFWLSNNRPEMLEKILGDQIDLLE